MKINWKTIAKSIWAPVAGVVVWFARDWYDAYREQHHLTDNTDQQVHAVAGFFSFVTTRWFIAVIAGLAGLALGVWLQKRRSSRGGTNRLLGEIMELRGKIESVLDFERNNIRADDQNVRVMFAVLAPEVIAIAQTARKAGFQFPQMPTHDPFEIKTLLAYLRLVEPMLERGHVKEAKQLAATEASRLTELYAGRQSHLEQEHR